MIPDRRYFLCALCVVIGAFETPVGSQMKAMRPAQQQLGTAITLVLSDDDSPQAEKLLQSIASTQPVTTPDGETARYYLGRLYHRNYYMLRQANGLSKAADEYKDIHNSLEGLRRPGKWYGEARFYKSLAYLELGKWKDAFEAINNIEANLDPDIQIDYLRWSINKRTVNASFPTQELKTRYLSVLAAHNITRDRPDRPDSATSEKVFRALQETLEFWGRSLRGTRR